MNHRIITWAAVAILGAGGIAHAGSTIVAQYKMGELESAGGTLVGGTPANLLPTVGSVNMPVFGTPTLQAGGPATALGGSTHFMRFDGVTQRFEVTPDLLGNTVTDGWMVEAWVRPQAGGSGLGFVASHGEGGKGQIINYDAGADRYGWFVGGVGQFNGTIGASGVGTAWDHLALVREGGITRLYVNGSLAGSNSASGTTPYNNGSGIGSQYTGGANHGFTGDIDEVYYSTVSGFNAATDLHMSNPPDPSIAVPTQPVDAGTIVVGANHDMDVYIDNTGATNTLTITSVSSLAGDTGKFVLQTSLPLNIAPGGSGTLVFRYTPGAVAGTHNATFTIGNNDTSNPSPAITLTGTAVTDPNIIVPSTLAFGTVAKDSSPQSKNLQVENTGWNKDLTLSAAVVSGDTAYFTVSSVPSTVAPGGAGDIVIAYDPLGNLGDHHAVLEITHNDPDLASPVQVTLTGKSIPRYSEIAHYKLGENDSSLATTVDDIGGYNLDNINPTPGTTYNSGSGVAGSTVGINETLNDVYRHVGVPTELAGRIADWGIQGWVRPELATGSAQMGAEYGGLYLGVGSGSRGGFSVFSIDGSHWGLNVGGITAPNSIVPIKGGVWTHVAAVAAGNQVRLYINGLLAYTYGGTAHAPDDNGGNTPNIEFGGQVANSYRSVGGLDEASIFTFASGGFAPATDLHVTPPADADGDGLPDLWEDKYFGNNDGIVTWAELAGTDGTGDADGDGLTDLAEYQLGSDPTNADDPVVQKLVITGSHKTGGAYTVNFTGSNGKTYLLKKSLTLQDGFPTQVDSVTLSGTNAGTLMDAAATEDKAFYRIESPATP